MGKPFFLGAPVKVISFFFLALSLSASAQDDLGRELGKRCDLPEMKKQVGSKGSCRVVVVPKKFDNQLICSGTLGTLNCITTFDPQKAEKLNLTCLGSQNISFNFSATGTSHNIATVINRDNGTDSIIISESELVTISSEVVNIILEDNKGLKTASVLISYRPGFSAPLKNVQCQ